MTIESGFNQDFLDILIALDETQAEFLVVGAHAMALHGVPRATGDLDLFVRASSANAQRVLEALVLFGAPVGSHGLAAEDLERQNMVYQLGLPPRRIDLMTSISGVSFQDAWDSRETIEIGEHSIPFIGLDALIKNKQATARDKDLVDARLLTARK
ncbi:MAG: hypothetical protein R3200_06535 [Xanthomonadales bacterium]|nr:hypothetical protein [Xanthomonadales bacterium]